MFDEVKAYKKWCQFYCAIFLGGHPVRVGLDEQFQRYGHSKLYKTADGRHLGFGPTGNSAIRSAVLEPKYEMDRMTRCRDSYGRSQFSKMRGRSVGCRSSRLHCSHILMYARSKNDDQDD